MRVESLKLKVKRFGIRLLSGFMPQPAKHFRSEPAFREPGESQFQGTGFGGFERASACFPLKSVAGWLSASGGLLLALLLSACAQSPTATPQATLVPSLTASPDIQAAVIGTMTALADVPKHTVTPAPGAATAEATPEATPLVVTIQPFLGKNLNLPMDVTLPKGWELIKNDVLLMADIRPEGIDPNNTISGIPITAFRGPVTGGIGTIVVLWGFPNLVNPFPQNGTPTAPDLWSDGLRLLRSAVLDPKCNIGTDLKRTYRIGLESAVGTQFAAISCPNEPDTRGWFAGLQQNNLNFVFYVYTDPIAAMDSGRDELQAILDTVRFKPLPEATAAP
jgi:hypothetical protein